MVQTEPTLKGLNKPDIINPFSANVSPLYSLKTGGFLLFPGGYRSGIWLKVGYTGFSTVIRNNF